jgi:hypothetical protein|tara:strand:+ start:260 stop:838 length:579 start_codon:yes stop_codon:yes gene_type:complete
MANRNTSGFGLRAANMVGGQASVQGQQSYKIDAGHNANIFNGEFVKIDHGGTQGYIVGGQGSAAQGIGVLNGIFFNAADTNKPTFSNFYKQPITPANSEDIEAFVIDNPFQQYVVATDAATTQASFLRTFDMNTSAGDTTTGKSSATLDIAVVGDNNKQFRLLKSAEDPENSEAGAFRSVVVICNKHTYVHQ